MKKQSLIALIGAVILVVLVLPSCNKLFGDHPRGRYVIKGYLKDSCEGTPLANHTLVIGLTDHLIKNKHSGDKIASGVTDASGYFAIACFRYSDDGEISMIDSTTGFLYTDGYPIYYTDTLLDFGNVYLKPRVNATVHLNIVGSYGLSDTLFIGSSAGTVYKYYYPVPSIVDTVFFTGLISGYGFGSQKYYPGILFWGVGINDFKSNLRGENFYYRVCDLIDTPTVITLKYP